MLSYSSDVRRLGFQFFGAESEIEALLDCCIMLYYILLYSYVQVQVTLSEHHRQKPDKDIQLTCVGTHIHKYSSLNKSAEKIFNESLSSVRQHAARIAVDKLLQRYLQSNIMSSMAKR